MKSVIIQVRDQVYDQVRDQVYCQVFDEVYYKVCDQVRVKSGIKREPIHEISHKSSQE
jgi:hypothetical protein